jgi:hypothetical protein
MSEKRFIVLKYVMAPTAAEAIKRESAQPADEVFLEELPNAKAVTHAIGFHLPIAQKNNAGS